MRSTQNPHQNIQSSQSQNPQQQPLTRSSIGLTSQQKDLIIIHLKSEVYELKQSDNDYRQLYAQFASLEERLKYLKDDKDMAQRDYQSKIDAQERQIELAKRELDELKRLNGNKEKENGDAEYRIKSDRDQLKNNEVEYKRLREENEEQIMRNKHVKDEIAALEDQIEEEKRRQVELKSLKDKLSHQLYRGAEDSEQLMEKEQELVRRAREKESEQRVLEEKLRRLEREIADKDSKQSHMKTQIASDETRVIQSKNQLQLEEDENHRLQEQQKRLRDQLHLESIKQEELHTRLREQQYKISRRDEENDQIVTELRLLQRDNDILKEKYENLVIEKNALQAHSEKINDANKEIEKELDSFVNLDDSIVRTLEKRDNNLSPVVSLYKPSNQPPQTLAAVQLSTTSGLGNYGVQPSRMFDLKNAESVKISPYSKIQDDQNYQRRDFQGSQHVNHVLSPQVSDLYKPSASYNFTSSNFKPNGGYNYDEFNRRGSSGAGNIPETDNNNYQSTYGREVSGSNRFANPSQNNPSNSSSLKFLNPRSLASPNQSSSHIPARELSSKYLGVNSLDKGPNAYERKGHSPLRQSIY